MLTPLKTKKQATLKSPAFFMKNHWSLVFGLWFLEIYFEPIANYLLPKPKTTMAMDHGLWTIDQKASRQKPAARSKKLTANS